MVENKWSLNSNKILYPGTMNEDNHSKPPSKQQLNNCEKMTDSSSMPSLSYSLCTHMELAFYIDMILNINTGDGGMSL